MSAPGSSEYSALVSRAHQEARAWLERNGYQPLPPADPKYSSVTATATEWPKISAQMRLRAGEAPRSEAECMWATIEALTQESVYAWPGDGTSIVAQMIWAQHRRAEKAEEELARLKGDVPQE